MAVGALRRIKEQGLRIPDDISIVSFDDVPLFRLHESGITAIAQPVAKIAETISSMLMTRFSDRGHTHAPHTITLDCDIILRGSTRRLLTPENIAKRPRR
jgi:LacI family transcriptional regulator